MHQSLTSSSVETEIVREKEDLLCERGVLCLRDPAEEGGGAAGTRGQTRARGERRGHHPVPPHRCGVQRLRGRLRV